MLENGAGQDQIELPAWLDLLESCRRGQSYPRMRRNNDAIVVVDYENIYWCVAVPR